MAEGTDSAPQSLVGFMSNDEWDALLAHVNALMQRVDALPPGETRDIVFNLLDGIDAIHRESLRRLVRLFKEGVLEAVISDPAIHELMELYDLLPQKDGAPVRKAFPVVPIRSLRSTAPVPHAHWVPLLAHADELPAPGLRDDVEADGVAMVLARRDDEWFAVDAACPVDGASLRGARLDGYTLTCPVHAGCHYDVRSGARIGGGTSLTCHPVRVETSGRVLVGLGMAFRPGLPSF